MASGSYMTPIYSRSQSEVQGDLHKRPADIHKEIVSVYGNIMNRQNVTKWCHHFSEENGGSNVAWNGALGHHLGGKSFHDDDEIKDEVEM
ncbi:hypothetical protein TNCV_3682911 [Trichonephila clavipes]|uniref:Uncharacterized protein n=1 Tax=Trichonephila clavipes TaxID=2585209 RepID=A0A8X6RCS3_TRICX|nr:hypothetical protein TNCV_3682911 [Trichonephila clavipes]